MRQLPKCDYCGQPGISLTGETNEVLVCIDHARKAYIAEGRAEGAEAAIERARDVLDRWEHDGPNDAALHLLIRRVREALSGGVA